MKKELRFPTILGIILLLVAISAGVYFSGSKVTLGSKASGGCNPQNVQITNLTHTGATVSFTTTSTCRANIDINNQTVNDLKLETINNPDLATHIHYFEIKRLKEKTTYDFSIISGGNSFNDSTYKFTTGSTPSSTTPTSNIAWGKVFAKDGKTPGNAIVYLNIPGAYPLSSIVTTNGNWSISLANSFNESKNNWFTPAVDPVNEDIVVISEDGVTTQVVNTTARNNPVPNIVIGTNTLEASLTTPTEASTKTTGEFQSVTPVFSQKNIDITNPKEGDILNVSRPDFFGSAPANSRVIVEVHSAEAITSDTTADATGVWHWSPSSNLSPGEHTITVKSQNGATGLWETVTRKFTVLAADNTSGPSFEASGSATPTLVPTATMAPTATPIPTERVAKPSVSVKPPVTGNMAPTIAIIFSSVLFILISYKLLL